MLFCFLQTHNVFSHIIYLLLVVSTKYYFLKSLPSVLILCIFVIIHFFSHLFSVRKQVVNIPSFIVRLDSQKHIDFSLKSPFGGGRAGRVKRKNLKKGQSSGVAEEEDED